MKNKIIAIVFSLVGTVCLCSPIDSMLGADGVEREPAEEIQNLWVWPTEYEEVTGGPSRLKDIAPGVWYIRFAANGYANNSFPELYYFTDNSFHSVCQSGYSMTQVFDLDPGEYELSYDYFTDWSQGMAVPWISTYEPSGSMWLYKERITLTIIARQRFADYTTDVIRFSIPGGVLTNVAIAPASGYSIDVWNVVLQKVN